MMINSTKSSVECLGNSIDNYIQMENLYLQDGKVNLMTNNQDINNINNIAINNNKKTNLKNSKNSYNKMNEIKKEELNNQLNIEIKLLE